MDITFVVLIIYIGIYILHTYVLTICIKSSRRTGKGLKIFLNFFGSFQISEIERADFVDERRSIKFTKIFKIRKQFFCRCYPDRFAELLMRVIKKREWSCYLEANVNNISHNQSKTIKANRVKVQK